MHFLIVLLACFSVVQPIEYSHLAKKMQTQVNGGYFCDDVEAVIKSALKEMSQQLDLQICGNNGTKLYEAVIKSIDCVKKTILDDKPICDTVTTTFKKCIKPVEERLETCLQDETNEMPKLFVDSIYSTAKYICDSKVRDIVELGNPCLTKAVGDVGQCINNLRDMLEDFEPTKNLRTSLCKEFAIQRKCFITQVSKHCKQEVTKNAYVAFYNASVITPCAS